MIEKGSAYEGETDHEMSTESFYSCQSSSTEDDSVAWSCISTTSTSAHCDTSQDSSHSEEYGENVWQQGDEEDKGRDSSVLANSTDVIYCGDEEQEQLETSNGQGGVDSDLSGGGIDEKIHLGGEILDKVKMRVGRTPHSDRFQIRAEEEHKCGSNSFTDDKLSGQRADFSINPCPYTTHDTGTGNPFIHMLWVISSSFLVGTDISSHTHYIIYYNSCVFPLVALADLKVQCVYGYI